MLNIHKILGRSNNLFYEDIVGLESKIQNFISNSSFLIVGAAGSIGKEVTKQVFMRGPKKLDAVDINENELADLTRQLRSSFDNNSTSYRSLVIDMGSKIFSNFINQQEKYDYVINLAALKHVRSEKDPFTLMRLIEVNIINSIKLFRLTSPARKYFCVSTDKAANPVNFMGLSKRIMESYLANEQNNLTYSSARFANVAFSNGSILQSFKRRIELRQPIACPSDIERFFVTPEESGQLCLLSIIFGFNALATVFGEGEAVPKTVNPTNFKGSELIEAMAKVKEFKRIIDNNTELADNYPLFKSIKDNTDRVYRQLSMGDDEDPRDMANKMAIKLLEPKLERKPGNGNHLVNVKSDGDMKFFQIDFDKLDSDELLDDFVVKQSAIVIDFDKIWG